MKILAVLQFENEFSCKILKISGNSGRPIRPRIPPFVENLESVVPQGDWASQRSQIGALDPDNAEIGARTPGWCPAGNVDFRGGGGGGEASPPAATRPHLRTGVREGSVRVREGPGRGAQVVERRCARK